MKRCPSCGKSTADDSLDFCTHCGAYFVVRPGGSPPPDTSRLPDDPMERGETLMEVGRFPEGAAAFREALQGRPEVDDAVYGRIVDAVTGCMLGISLQPQAYKGADIPRLAQMMPDRELLVDVMGRLARSLDVCSIQNGVLGLANSYMYLFVDTFHIYTDARDMEGICETARDDLRAMLDRAVGLVDAYPGRGPGPLEWLSSYSSFVDDVLDTVSDIVTGQTGETLDRLASRWSEASKPTYAVMVGNAFLLITQSAAAGKFSSRILRKTGGTQLKGFEKTYLAGPRG